MVGRARQRPGSGNGLPICGASVAVSVLTCNFSFWLGRASTSLDAALFATQLVVSLTADKAERTPAGALPAAPGPESSRVNSAVFALPGTLRVGRYVVGDRIAAGGMATVHIGRLRGAAGFSRTVAIKRLLPEFACNPEFESLFVQEARLVARIQHPNVVSTLDVVAEEGELILVMDYVAGETLARLMQAGTVGGRRVPQHIVLAIARDALCGLHAAHEARDRKGDPLDIVHRDISPQNLLVGSDGVTRVLDFGIAKAATSVELTRQGLVRGKAAYMAPEQLFGAPVTRRADIYALAVVLWEILVGQRLFPGGVRPELSGDGHARIPSPRAKGAPIGEALDAIVMRALAPNAGERFQTAQEMAEQISSSFRLATREEVASWVEATAGPELAQRAALVQRIESAEASIAPPPSERASSLRSPALAVNAGSIVAMSRAAPARPTSWPRMRRRVSIAAAFAGMAVGSAVALSRTPTAGGQVQPAPVEIPSAAARATPALETHADPQRASPSRAAR